MWKEISSFEQQDIESLPQVWARYGKLLQAYYDHGLPLWKQVQIFYEGLNPLTRELIDKAAGGSIHYKTPEATFDLIVELSMNYNFQRPNEAWRGQLNGTPEEDALSPVATQLEQLSRRWMNGQEIWKNGQGR